MKGNQGLDALAALCGGTFGSNLADDSKLLEGTTAERSGMLGPTSAGANGDATLRYPSSNTAMSDVMTPQQWQQYFLASGCGGGSAPTSGTDPSAAAVAALFTAASCKQSRDGRAPQFNQAASLFQQLALNYQGQYATMYNAHAATQFAQQHSQQPHLAPSLTGEFYVLLSVFLRRRRYRCRQS